MLKAGDYVIVNGKMQKCFEFAQEIHELKSKMPAEEQVGVWGHKTSLQNKKGSSCVVLERDGPIFHIAIPAFSPKTKTGWVFANEKWAQPVSGTCLAWVLVPCSDAPLYYVPCGLVLANFKEKTLDAGQPWTIFAPKPPKAPKKAAKRQNEPTEDADGDAKRQRAGEPAGESSEPVDPAPEH